VGWGGVGASRDAVVHEAALPRVVVPARAEAAALTAVGELRAEERRSLVRAV
jgi:hypothetical protein